MWKRCTICDEPNLFPMNKMCKECFYANTDYKKKKPIKQKSTKNTNTPAKFTTSIKQQILDRDKTCINCSLEWTQYHHAYFGANANRKSNRNDLNQWVLLCEECHHEIHHWTTWEWKVIRARCIVYLKELYGV